MRIYLKNCNNYLILLSAFFITLSTYVSTIVTILFFLCFTINIILLIKDRNLKQQLKIVFSNPVVYSTIIFLLYFFARLLLTEQDPLLAFNELGKKQIILLLIPVLFTLQFDEKYIKAIKYSFLTGLLLNIIISTASTIINSNKLIYKSTHYDTEKFFQVFIDHFEFSMFLCFGILLIISSEISKKKHLLYISSIIVFITVLVNSWGRVGIVAFFIFSPIIILFFNRSKINLVMLFFGILYITFSYFAFSPFKDRINSTLINLEKIYTPPSLNEKIKANAEFLVKRDHGEIITNHQIDSLKNMYIENIKSDSIWLTEINNKHPQYETSVGKRYQWLQRSLELIQQKPFLGFGSNQFKKTYIKQFSKNEIEPHNHPHNNFMFILVELGGIGLIFLLFIFCSQIRCYFINKKENILQFIFPLFFLFTMLFDNYFLNQNTLIFFCLFTFMIYRKSLVNSFDPS